MNAQQATASALSGIFAQAAKRFPARSNARTKLQAESRRLQAQVWAHDRVFLSFEDEE